MLPEICRDPFIEFPRDMPISGSVLRDGVVDARELEKRARLIQKGMPPLLVLSQDARLCDWIDELPMNFAVSSSGIESIEQSLIHADAQMLETVFQEGEEICGTLGNILKRKFDALHSYSYERINVIQKKELRRLNIPFIQGGDSPLDAAQKPDDIRLVKMFNPADIISSWSIPTSFQILQSKFLRSPFVVSAYVNEESMTYHGVGVSASASRIIRSYPTDADSGPTTPLYSPDPYEVDERNVQITRWDDVRLLSVVKNAHKFNPHGFWWPELFVDLYQLQSVVVRPYHSWVAYSYQCLGNIFDRHRAVAATMLARALNRPIEVLE